MLPLRSSELVLPEVSDYLQPTTPEKWMISISKGKLKAFQTGQIIRLFGNVSLEIVKRIKYPLNIQDIALKVFLLSSLLSIQLSYKQMQRADSLSTEALSQHNCSLDYYQNRQNKQLVKNFF